MQNILALVLIVGLFFSVFPSIFAEPTVNVVLEKTSYTYCEKLFYTIEVSEVTGDPAIIHIRDETGKGSSAIPIQISSLQNPVPSLVPFEKEVFPLGKYFLDVEYAGIKQTVEFELIDSENVCIPAWIKQLTYYWVTEQISDNSYSDGIKFLIEEKIIVIPETQSETETIQTEIPNWVKVNALWWFEEKITDNDFAQALQYLIKIGVIII